MGEDKLDNNSLENVDKVIESAEKNKKDSGVTGDITDLSGLADADAEGCLFIIVLFFATLFFFIYNGLSKLFDRKLKGLTTYAKYILFTAMNLFISVISIVIYQALELKSVSTYAQYSAIFIGVNIIIFFIIYWVSKRPNKEDTKDNE